MDRSALTLSLLGEEDFAGYRLPWNDLLKASSCQSFFLGWEWMYTYWETMERANATLLVVLCHDGEELVGIAPLYAYATTFMKLPVTKIAFLGDRVAGDYMDIIARPGHEERCCRSVLQFLREGAPIDYDLIELDAVCTDSHLFRHAAHEPAEAAEVSVDFRFECPRAMLGSSYEEYVERLTASTRYAIGRRERKLQRHFAGVEVANVDLHQQVGLLDVLFDLHGRRWEAFRPGESTFHSEFRMRFNRELLGRLPIGEGYFSLVSVSGKPVSIVYVFSYKKHAFFYQNGWAPDLAPYGVGLIGVQHALRHAAETGCESFDFLRGEEPYKYDFCGDIRRAYAIRVFGRGARGRVLERLFTLKGGIKRGLAAARVRMPGAAGGATRAGATRGIGAWN
jgi:CelD/BcsL family acetyltransferase involved in cellulose biosynthesis